MVIFVLGKASMDIYHGVKSVIAKAATPGCAGLAKHDQKPLPVRNAQN